MNTFTFYLSSVFDFLHYRSPDLLHRCLTEGLAVTPAPTELLTGGIAASLAEDPFVKESIAEHKEDIVFRDVTLPDGAEALHVDLLLVGLDRKSVSSIAVQAEYNSDSPTRSDGIERALRSAFGDETRTTSIYLSTTGDNDLSGPRLVAPNHRNGTALPRVVLWSRLRAVIEGFLSRVDDDYFTWLFHRVCRQIERENEASRQKHDARAAGDGSSFRELALLVEEIALSGGSVEEARNSGHASLSIATTRPLWPFAEQIGSWLSRTVERGSNSGRLRPVSFKTETSNATEPAHSDARHLGSALSDLWHVSMVVGMRRDVPASVRDALQLLQSTIRYALGADPRAVLIDRFLATCASSFVSDFYRRVLDIANVRSNCYLRVSSGRNEDVGSLELSVLSSAPGTSGLVPLVRLECERITIFSVV